MKIPSDLQKHSSYVKDVVSVVIGILIVVVVIVAMIVMLGDRDVSFDEQEAERSNFIYNDLNQGPSQDHLKKERLAERDRLQELAAYSITPIYEIAGRKGIVFVVENEASYDILVDTYGENFRYLPDGVSIYSVFLMDKLDRYTKIGSFVADTSQVAEAGYTDFKVFYLTRGRIEYLDLLDNSIHIFSEEFDLGEKKDSFVRGFITSPDAVFVFYDNDIYKVGLKTSKEARYLSNFDGIPGAAVRGYSKDTNTINFLSPTYPSSKLIGVDVDSGEHVELKSFTYETEDEFEQSYRLENFGKYVVKCHNLFAESLDSLIISDETGEREFFRTSYVGCLE